MDCRQTSAHASTAWIWPTREHRPRVVATPIAFVHVREYTRGMDDHKNARFLEADFSGARFHGVNFSNVKISDAWLFNVEISGLVGNLSVNGVDVSAYVEAELNQRHPERLLLAPFDPDGMRSAWKSIEDFSAATLRPGPRPASRQARRVGRRGVVVPRDPPASRVRHRPLDHRSGVARREPVSSARNAESSARRSARRHVRSRCEADPRRGAGRATRADGPGRRTHQAESTPTSSTGRCRHPTAARPPS